MTLSHEVLLRYDFRLPRSLKLYELRTASITHWASTQWVSVWGINNVSVIKNIEPPSQHASVASLVLTFGQNLWHCDTVDPTD